ncbi:MAG: galactokinase [Akkermansiaceae bacterium]|nr:galactokinase [Akkermansiaceae bacterium]NNM31081.1 galactokinase [Akkermansiaceae bacterium]
MLQSNEPLADLAADAKAHLRHFSGSDAAVVAAAPGRVNLIGEHIDYCDGFVLPLAIERYIVIAAAPNDRREARIRTVGNEHEAVIPLDQPVEKGDPGWSNYLRGVLEGFRKRGNWPIPGFDAHIVSSVPPGGGLSSSAALELATATLLEGLADTTLDTKEKALLCQKAEHDFAGVPCGIMDQFASAFGKEDHLVFIDCQSEDPELIPFHAKDLTVLVANTMVSHELNDGAYADRRKDTEEALAMIGKRSWRAVNAGDIEARMDEMGDRIYRRSRHVVSEIARTATAAAALKNDDYASLGPLMAGSHQSLRDDFEVSCRELDLMVEIADRIGFEGGVLGSRMTGGGFGGSTVTLCRTEQVRAIAAELADSYLEQTGVTPQLFASRPAQGAHLL